MKLNALILLGAAALVIASGPRALAQSEEIKRYEVGAQFSILRLDEGFRTRTEPGLGGRFTVNLTDNFALEAQGDFFPRRDTFNAFRTGGHPSELLMGAKIGKRFHRFGIFAKARPGLISFSQGVTEFIPQGPTSNPFSDFSLRTKRLTHFAFDIGGVLEIYHSRRIFTRIDAGDTIIRYGQTTVDTFAQNASGAIVQSPFIVPGDTQHNLQVSVGVGFRF